MKKSKNYWYLTLSWSAAISSVFLSTAVTAAERIAISYPPFGEFYLDIENLETLADTGKITPELAYYTNRFKPEQVNKLQELLSTPLELNPLSIYKFSNSTIGEAVIKNFGKGIRGDVDRNGFLALRGAIISAAFNSEGLTIINILRNFPLKTIYVDLQSLGQYIEKGGQIISDRDLLIKKFFYSNNKQQLEANSYLELQTRGEFNWKKYTLTYDNPHRVITGYFDLYVPEASKTPVPVIIISHGLASNRQTFAYLGKHLTSHGFAVAVVEHYDISLDKFDGLLSGLERFPEPDNLINQPLDIKYVLDKLEQKAASNPSLQGKLNLEQIGAIGHSFGGYTVLALAGGKLIRDEIASECQADEYDRVLLDLSSLAKCTFYRLPARNYQLQDKRIKAVIALNPLGKIFGREGIKQIKIPTAIVSGTNDLITPPVVEQIQPFTWLEHPEKYLLLVQLGTHFSFLQEGLGVLPVPDALVGPSSSLASPALQAFSTAFFKTHIAEQPEYQVYLTSDRISAIDSDPFKLSLIRSLTTTELEQAIERRLD